MFETLTQRLTAAFSSLAGKRELSADDLEEGLRAVRAALLEADVHFQVARDVTERVRDRIVGSERMAGVDPSQQFAHAFHAELVELMGPEDAGLQMASGRPTVILIAGLQGAGKTTTCAKLAKRLRKQHQKRPLLVAADIKRPAAVEQLRVLGRQLDVPVFHEEGLTAPELCKRGIAAARAGGQDVVILDTAGRLHVDDELMQELGLIARSTKPDNQVLVVDAMTGQDAVRSAEAFHAQLDLTGVILTKLDGDARGGAAVSLKAVTGRPILFVGTGEKLDDLDAFGAERMAGRILGMGDVVGLVERAQETIDEKDAQASYEKLVMGSFTLEDMLGQLRMIRKLGPMKKVLGMMPGMGGLLDKIDVDDRHTLRMEALFTSMTVKERLHPELLDMSRRRRVARGAGQELGAVNELLKSFKGMKQMMKQMNKLGMGAKLGSKGKRAALEALSADGQLADPGAAGGGLMAGLGGLGQAAGGLGKGLAGMLGGGGSGAGMGDLASMLGGGAGGGAGARPGRSATRKSGSKRKRKQKKGKGGKRR